MIKLDVGSGTSKKDGYITLDKEPVVNADICMDFEKKELDFSDVYFGTLRGTFDEIRASHILEHFKPENKVLVMRRLNDLLKEGGILDIAVPKFPSAASIQDPTHLSFWNRESFWYFTKGNKYGEGFIKRTPNSPLFEFVEDNETDWSYSIKLKKI